MKFEIPEQVNKALGLLHGAGFEAYMIGGCVRDYIMGKVPYDYDIATSALPEETKGVFGGFKVLETGLKHGTVTVIIDGMNLEITTFRVEEGYSDNRHPDKVVFTRSLRDDAGRRDFTMNGLAFDGSGQVVDYFGGIEDINSETIRCIGTPELRFKEDGLRIMRALRFASVLGFKLDEETEAAARNCKILLQNVSAERIREELLKLLMGRDARRVLVQYADIIGAVLPEIAAMDGFDQRNKHHIYDVLEHTAVTVENVPFDPVLRMAALLHDSGKVETFTADDEGVGHFYGHSRVSEEISERILTRLKFDNESKKAILTLVKYHDYLIDLTEKAVKRAFMKMGPELYFKLLDLKRADNLAQNPDYRHRLKYIDELEAIGRKIIEDEACFSLKDLAVKGGDLIAIGVKPGKELGYILDQLLEGVIDGSMSNSKEELLKQAEKMAEEMVK